MVQKNQIGVYVGTELLSFVEAQKGKLLYSEDVPHFQVPAEGAEASENIQLTASLQKILRNRQIANPRVDLSLPAKDVIFRTFVVPNMTTSEIQNAVNFEARKYIPFKIEDLVYTFRAVPFTENQIKKNRILFLAILKETLAKYSQIFEQANGKVISAEPASMNLFRLLIWKKKIQPDEKIAIIQINNDEGAITIIEKQMPQFIRDFHLFSTNKKETETSLEEIITRIRNEVRVSRDFYKRQFSSLTEDHGIQQIFVFSDKHNEEIANAIESEAEVKTSIFDISQVDQGAQSKLMSHPTLTALGASLRSAVQLPSELDLITAQTTTTAAGMAFEDIGSRPANYYLTAKIAGACALALGIVFWISYSQKLPLLSKLDKLHATEKEYQDFSAQTLRQKTIQLKLTNKQNSAIRFRSNMASLLSLLPTLLPQGVWLDIFNIDYKDSLNGDGGLETKIHVGAKGYSYAEDLSKQINLVENFVKNLKNNEYLKQRIVNFKLNTVNKGDLQGFPVTLFQVTMILSEKKDD